MRFVMSRICLALGRDLLLKSQAGTIAKSTSEGRVEEVKRLKNQGAI